MRRGDDARCFVARLVPYTYTIISIIAIPDFGEFVTFRECCACAVVAICCIPARFCNVRMAMCECRHVNALARSVGLKGNVFRGPAFF